MTEFLEDLEGVWNDYGEWVWVALGVVVAIVVIGIVAGVLMARKRDRDIRHAAEIRTDARRQHDRIGAKDAEARRIEAEAQEARAEAERLEAVARDRRAAVDRDRSSYAERMREADRLDHRRTGTHAQR